jgi:hypothetical protein
VRQGRHENNKVEQMEINAENKEKIIALRGFFFCPKIKKPTPKDRLDMPGS